MTSFSAYQQKLTLTLSTLLMVLATFQLNTQDKRELTNSLNGDSLALNRLENR